MEQRKNVHDFPRRSCYPCRVMSALEAIVEDLKALPSDKVKDAAWFVHTLVVNSAKARVAVLQRTATALSARDVDELEEAITER